jgi:hypothetical protein
VYVLAIWRDRLEKRACAGYLGPGYGDNFRHLPIGETSLQKLDNMQKRSLLADISDVSVPVLIARVLM